MQERLLTVTEEAPPDVHFATNCLTIGDGLEEQIRTFVTEHPHTVLVAIDIFQKIRSNSEISYLVDYNEMEILKQRKSFPDLKAQAKTNLERAAQTATFIAVPEKAWSALIQTQKNQLDIY